MDRYFPRPPSTTRKAIGGRNDASLVAGSYVLSRGSFTNLMAITNLFGREVEVTANPDGSIVTPVLTSIDQTPRVWRPAGPFLWKLEDGERLYGAKLVDGKIAYLGEDDLAPIEVQLPTPLSLAAWNLPLLFCTIAMFALVVLFWPLKALLRWRYGRPFDLSGRAAWLYRGTRLVAAANLIFLGGFLAAFLLSTGPGLFTSPYDWFFRLLQLAGLAGILGTVVPAYELIAMAADAGRPWWTKATQGLTVLACLATVWLAFSLHLLSPSLLY